MADAEKYILWGSSGHAKVLADLINLKGGEVVTLFDNKATAKSVLPNVPLYIGESGFQAWLKMQNTLDLVSAAIAIGGALGKDRQEIGSLLKSAGITSQNLVHPFAYVSVSAELGEGCQVLANAVVSADVKVGDYCIINNNANVDHECELGAGVHIAPGAVICGCVFVGENTMIGAGAVVLPRIKIGRDAVVGAGAVVTRDVPDSLVVTGNPAKVFNRRL